MISSQFKYKLSAVFHVELPSFLIFRHRSVSKYHNKLVTFQGAHLCLFLPSLIIPLNVKYVISRHFCVISFKLFQYLFCFIESSSRCKMCHTIYI